LIPHDGIQPLHTSELIRCPIDHAPGNPPAKLSAFLNPEAENATPPLLPGSVDRHALNVNAIRPLDHNFPKITRFS